MPSPDSSLYFPEAHSLEVTPCPVCSHTGYTVDYRHSGIDYGHCAECGLAYTQPLRADDHESVDGENVIRTKDSYNSGLLKNFDAQQEQAGAIARRRVDFYAKVLGRTPRNLLDVGAGNGVFCSGFRACGVEWSGIDINPQMVEFCQSRGLPVQHAEFTRFEGQPPYDVIYSSQVLEHVLEPHTFLEHAKRLLAPDGVLHLDVPNNRSLMAYLRRTLLKGQDYGFLQPPYHLLAYSKPCMDRLIRDCGLQPVFVRAYSNDHPVFGQIKGGASLATRGLYAASRALGMGSLLVVLARPEAEGEHPSAG